MAEFLPAGMAGFGDWRLKDVFFNRTEKTSHKKADTMKMRPAEIAIIIAVITAVASIIVAVINNSSPSEKQNGVQVIVNNSLQQPPIKAQPHPENKPATVLRHPSQQPKPKTIKDKEKQALLEMSESETVARNKIRAAIMCKNQRRFEDAARLYHEAVEMIVPFSAHPTSETRAAQIFYDRHNFEEAVQKYEEILAKHSKR